MKLSKFCDETLVAFHIKATKKDKVIEELVDLVSTSTMVKDRDELLTDIKDRENLVTTGIGYGVAFPMPKQKRLRGSLLLSGGHRKVSTLRPLTINRSTFFF